MDNIQIEIFINLLVTILGILFIVKYKSFGQYAIMQRRWLNRFLPFPNRERDFDKTSIVITQILFLIIGLLFFLVGLVKLLAEFF